MHVAVETMPPFAMAGARFILAGATLFAIVKARGAPWPSARQWRDHTVIGAFLLLGGNGLVVWAQQYVPSGITALIVGATPLCIVLTEWAWPGGVRPSSVTFVGLALGFGGVAWLAAPWESAPSHALHPGGLTAILACTVFWSVGSIYSRHVRSAAPPSTASALQMIMGGAILAAVGVLHGDWSELQLETISTRSWIAFAYLCSVGSLIGFSTFVWLIEHSTPARVSTYAYVNPIVAVFLGWLILDEPITSHTVTAAALIIAAVVLITWPKPAPPHR